MDAVTPYFEKDGITIYHGDCREILPSLPKVDLVLTDPPYGVGLKYGESYNDSRKDYWDWFRERLDLMREAAQTVAFTHRIAALRELSGWDWIAVWHKRLSLASRVGNSSVLPHWEPIFLYGIHHKGVKGEYFNDVLTFNPDRGGKGTTSAKGWRRGSPDGGGHPVPKPVPLFKALADGLSGDGSTILDPFMGSGTTLVAARDLGRKAIGIEIEERYCAIAAKRLSQNLLPFGETP